MRQRLLKYVFPVVCLVALGLGQAAAQNRQISGKVTDAESGEGLPGVNVLETGTSNGTVTDINGTYSISVGANASLSFSFVGYTQQTIAVGARAVIDVGLSLDVQSLSEVVVVGYGTQDKKEITSSVASIKAEDFNKGTVNDPSQLLQGKVAGLSIAKSGNNPNGGFNVRLRGLSTVGANSQPLVVIDGVIGGSLNTIDPNDIATMDVLKDGSAAAIYGSRGSSGVILITTKSGKAGKTTVDYNGSVAIDGVARKVPVMTTSEYLSLDGANDLGGDTDWFDEITRTGVTNVHNLSMGGGTASTTYRASLNVRDVQGIALNSGFTSINGRLNLTQKALNDKLTLTGAISTTTKTLEDGRIASFRYAVYANPTMPVYDNTSADGIRYGGYYQQQLYDYYNPLAIVKQNPNDGKDFRILTSLRAEYDFSDMIDGLRLSAFYSSQNELDVRKSYISKFSYWAGGYPKGNASLGQENRTNQLLEYSLNYDKTFGDVNFAFVGGYSYQNFVTEGFGMSGGNFVTDNFGYNNIGAALDFANGLGGVGSGKNTYELQAGFGRINLNYQGTYFLSVSGRYEGSSRFGANNKYGLFPAVSAGANLSNIFSIPGISSLKVRGSFGITGNIPGSSYISLLRFGQVGTFYYNGAYGPSYGPIANANPDLKWEKKQEVDFGLDFAALDGRLTGTFDYYSRQTTDLIIPFNVPQPPNLAPQTYVNVGQLNNSGFEFALNYDVLSNADFTWTTGVNGTTLKTELVSLSGGDVSFGANGVSYDAAVGAPGQSGTNMIRVAEGEPLGQIWGPVFDGTNDDGTVILRDLDGDGSFCDCDADRTVIGNGLPKFFGGWNNSFRYKGFDLNIFIRTTLGHDLVNQFRTFYEPLIPGQVGSYNRVNTKYYDEDIKEAKFSDYYVEKADYVKLDNATLGYTIPLSPSSSIRNLRVYISSQNLFTLTGYTGVDPTERYVDTEDSDNVLSPGIERRDTYFTSRTLTFGVNLGF